MFIFVRDVAICLTLIGCLALPFPLYSFLLLFIFPPQTCRLSGTLCGNHLCPAWGSPCGFGGREGTVSFGRGQGCWPMPSTGSQLDCPLSREPLCAQSCVCPSCRGCRAAHRSVSLSESAPSLSPAAPPCPTLLCLNLKSMVWSFWSGFSPGCVCVWRSSRTIVDV